MTGAHAVLQVPVPELEPFVRQRHDHYDPDFVSADPAFVHAHITVLGPFLPPADIDGRVRSTIDEIACAVGEFDYRLEQFDVFPNGVIHLVPDPVEPFRSLTAELFTAFPSCPPYGGAFPDVRPHLTLDARSDGVTVESTRRLLGSLVPARCRAERLDLAWWGNGTCRVLDSWPLGGPQRSAAVIPAT
ncbi:MAG TPA: 2'-5' RNA ligase family protein [Intrasporangium sp.]|nr:2'-5' RNA ligase family protein [Intrasporangium sp.]